MTQAPIDMSPLLLQSLTAFAVTLTAIWGLAAVAPVLGLTDKPCQRKQHSGEIPLVGGLAIFAALIVGALVWGADADSLITVRGEGALTTFMVCAAVLVVTGSLDDRFHMGVFIRILSEVAVALIVIEALDLKISGLGDLLHLGNIKLPESVAYPFTVIAIFGIINAFNMLDGMDGLLASLVLVTLFTFHLFTETAPGIVSMFIGSSLVAFLASNLKLSPYIPKTFLGDAGSKLLGFIVVCLLLAATSSSVGGQKLIQPVTALFIVALPLFDMTLTSTRRILQRKSPFAADRSHIHHLLKDLGFGDRTSLMLILVISLSMTFLGLMLHRAGTPEYYKFAIFLSCFTVYSIFVIHGWSAAHKMQAMRAALKLRSEGGKMYWDEQLDNATEVEVAVERDGGSVVVINEYRG